MVGGAKGSFIGPIHRMAVRMDDLGDLVAGCFSRDAKTNAGSGAKFGLEPGRVYADWKKLIAAEAGKNRLPRRVHDERNALRDREGRARGGD